MDVESLAKQLILQNMTPEQQKAVLDSVRATLQEARGNQKRRVSENVGMVVDALKKIEADIRAKYDDLGQKIVDRVNSIRDGRDGAAGRDGRDGVDGRPGKDGMPGATGPTGRDGRDGMDGIDGVSVTDAKIDFDGSLVISLSNGREINVGEVVAPDLAERIKVITNGGGTSQTVIDTLASLQQQIDDLIPSQTGNSGKFLTTNGSVLSWASVAGGLSYQGTWNASTNTPTLASGTGTNGYYYVVATAGSTNLDGITDWQIGDWLLFNGTVWQKIDQSETLQFVTSTDSSVTVTTTGSTADLAVYSSPRVIAQVRNETGATLAKGTVVYISGASGNKATVSKAIATSDSTSAQTFGVIFADIANSNNGYAILSGDISGLDTSAIAAGTQLYLSSTTAGAYTTTKQYAPNHLVYVGVVTRSHVNQGSIEVRIQNGYEMDELHNVSAQTPSNGHVLIWNATTSLWESHALTAGAAIGITNGAGSITVNNTGVTSAVAGTGISVSNATGAVTISNTGVTSVSGTTGRITSSGGATPAIDLANGIVTAGTTGSSTQIPVITVDTYGRVTSITTASNPQGTVTSVTGTSPVASSGGATPAISLSSGYGDTQNPYASKTANYVLAAPNGSSGVPTFRAIVAADIPTLNQNTTGTASNVTGTVAIANGGTGATTLSSNAVLLGNGTSALQTVSPGSSGNLLTSDGTTWTSAAPPSGVPSGAVAHFAMSTAPTGWLKANGAAVSRSTYNSLFTAIGTTFGAGDGSTTFNLPDLRGYFARGWDDGAGVDSGRSFGSSQTDQIQEVTGNIKGVVTEAAGANFSVTGSITAGANVRTSFVGSGGGLRSINMGFDSSLTARSGTETRPVNIALLACIKY